MASGFVPTEMAWPSTWTDRRDLDQRRHHVQPQPLRRRQRRRLVHGVRRPRRLRHLPGTRNVTVVNNVFGAKCCGYAGPGVGYGDGQSCTGQGWVLAYNLFKDSAAGVGNNCAGETDTVYVGNIANDAAGGCPVRGTSTANLFVAPSPGACAGNRWLPDPSRIGLRRDGFHLRAGSPAINAGETTLCARYTGGIDIDGQPRSGVCDAGPDEYVP
jgi:hypothetical protein